MPSMQSAERPLWVIAPSGYTSGPGYQGSAWWTLGFTRTEHGPFSNRAAAERYATRLNSLLWVPLSVHSYVEARSPFDSNRIGHIQHDLADMRERFAQLANSMPITIFDSTPTATPTRPNRTVNLNPPMESAATRARVREAWRDRLGLRPRMSTTRFTR